MTTDFLQWSVPIVDPKSGLPTPQFIRFFQTHTDQINNNTGGIDSKADKTTAINTGTGLTGGGDLSVDRTLALADTAVTPGTYGDATHSARVTVDQQGRLTSASSVPISGGGGSGWTPLTFSGTAQTRWGGSSSYLANETLVTVKGTVVELYVVLDRPSAVDNFISISTDNISCIQLALQSDTNLVLYDYTSTGGSSSVIGPGGGPIADYNYAGTHTLQITVGVNGAGKNYPVAMWNGYIFKTGQIDESTAPMLGTMSFWVNADIGKILKAAYRVIPS